MLNCRSHNHRGSKYVSSEKHHPYQKELHVNRYRSKPWLACSSMMSARATFELAGTAERCSSDQLLVPRIWNTRLVGGWSENRGFGFLQNGRDLFSLGCWAENRANPDTRGSQRGAPLLLKVNTYINGVEKAPLQGCNRDRQPLEGDEMSLVFLLVAV